MIDLLGIGWRIDPTIRFWVGTGRACTRTPSCRSRFRKPMILSNNNHGECDVEDKQYSQQIVFRALLSCFDNQHAERPNVPTRQLCVSLTKTLVHGEKGLTGTTLLLLPPTRTTPPNADDARRWQCPPPRRHRRLCLGRSTTRPTGATRVQCCGCSTISWMHCR